MKKAVVILLAMLLCLSCAAAEETDAVTSATLAIDALPAVEAEDNGILVVYFSPDDTTRAAAYAAAAGLKAAVLEIAAAEPYTAEDLNYMDSKARSMTEMRDASARPEMTAIPPESLEGYTTVFLCYPIWGGQAPKILCTFLESADLSGKTVIPFCTSNSSGIGSSGTTLQKLTGETVTWLAGARVPKGSTAEEIAALALGLLPE